MLSVSTLYRAVYALDIHFLLFPPPLPPPPLVDDTSGEIRFLLLKKREEDLCCTANDGWRNGWWHKFGIMMFLIRTNRSVEISGGGFDYLACESCRWVYVYFFTYTNLELYNKESSLSYSSYM